MVTQDSNARDESNGGLTTVNHRSALLGLYLFLVFASAALVLPHATLLFWGVYWAALAACIVLAVWFGVMPTTCMSGGLICSLVAIMALFNTVGIVLLALVKFTVSLFS